MQLPYCQIRSLPVTQNTKPMKSWKSTEVTGHRHIMYNIIKQSHDEDVQKWQHNQTDTQQQR